MNAPSVELVRIAEPDRLFIGGRWIDVEGTDRLRPVNPATEAALPDVAAAGPAEVERAVAAARAAFDRGPWPRMAPSERAAAMRRLSAALQRRATTADSCWLAQVGVPVWMSRGASAGAAGLLDMYAAMAETYPFERIGPAQGIACDTAVVVREAVGVVAAIAPWNGPLASLLVKLAPALAAGCTVILKPAPETPLEAFVLAEAAEEADLPPGVINLLPADREASDMLVHHPGVDKVAFTGSTGVGLHIAQVCASRMARYTMELGGKSAAIVLDDYDPAELGPALAPLVTMLCGQACINFSRILVPRARYDAYVESLASAMQAVTVGDPEDIATMMGPLAMARHRDKVFSYIERGRAEGARIATGGGRPVGMERGYFIEPTVFADASNSMTIAQEEIFGPVTAVIPYATEEEAIAIANASEFGLSGGVYTQDTDRAYAIARAIRTGTFTQNGREFDLTHPFGGFKKSGVGREGGVEGLEAFCETKSVFLPRVPTCLQVG
ncbi:aldehyde dehydrogenase [Novosphingobium sp. ERN07]|uniref:aldehyde dehydrogenase n=1 Tax=Novosphingobium sp. ERN07 TaxID=2726187 RepID=UPI00145682EC|nr:aldehyde dehydrogenase [Novosphingobium sp. ERN07]NLR73039.1 aldehyde dehydrogenase [Novosphingobium sp. ERN07]